MAIKTLTDLLSRATFRSRLNDNFRELYAKPNQIRIANRYITQAIFASGTTTQAHAINTLRAFPIFISEDVTLTEIISEVTTLQAASTYRIGIYTDSAGYPNELVAGTDALAYDSTGNGVKSSGALSIALTANIYWIATNSNNVATMRAVSSSMMPSLGVSSALGSNSIHNGITVASTYGAMPSTFPGGGTYTLQSNVVLVGLKTN